MADEKKKDGRKVMSKKTGKEITGRDRKRILNASDKGKTSTGGGFLGLTKKYNISKAKAASPKKSSGGRKSSAPTSSPKPASRPSQSKSSTGGRVRYKSKSSSTGGRSRYKSKSSESKPKVKSAIVNPLNPGRSTAPKAPSADSKPKRGKTPKQPATGSRSGKKPATGKSPRDYITPSGSVSATLKKNLAKVGKGKTRGRASVARKGGNTG